MPTDVYEDFSEFYDLYVGDRLDDLPLYLDYARSARTPVLEIGAGSGRLTLPLAQAGIPVVAVDISPSMLAILESRLAEQTAQVRQRVQVVLADACELELAARYDLILIPFYTFNYFLTPEAQRAVLERCHAHLSRQGRLLIDVFIPLSRLRDCPTEPLLRVDTVDPRTGSKVRGWNVYSIDKERQIEHRKHIFEVTPPDGIVRRKEFNVQRRYFFPAELERLFASFVIEDVFTGYKREPASASSEQLLYVLRQR
jgi:SAM-dependent methyltransferase